MKSWSQYWLAVFSSFVYPRKRKRKKAPSPPRYCPWRRRVHQNGHVPATSQSLNEIVAHRLSKNAREFLTLVLCVISLSEADAVPLVKLHDRRKLGEGHLLPWDRVRHLKQAADAILLLGRSRSYGSLMGVLLKICLSFSSAVVQEKRPSCGCPILNAWQRCLFRARFR